MNENYIIGRNTLEEVVKHRPSILKKVYISAQEKKNERKDRLILSLLEINSGISIKYVSKGELYSLVKTDSHQSFVAEIKSRNFLDLKTFFKNNNDQRKKSIVVMLDNILDPQNFGAILRSSECFGVDGVVFSKNRSCGITPATTKVASGASELINLIRVSNLVDTIKKFKKEGYIAIVAENSPAAIDLYQIQKDKHDKILLIMGSEGKGVQSLIRKEIDMFLKIPLSGEINSLNVSSATATILSYLSYFE